MRRRIILGAVALILLAIGGFVLRIFWLAGSFRSIQPHFAGTCRLIEGPVGPEDITIHPTTGIAYISASDRRAKTAGAPVPGALWAYDLNDPAAQPVNITPKADLSFQPHGISLWSDGGRRDVLFVINHPAPGSSPHTDTVEVFDVTGTEITHRATLSDPLLVMPNDLVAVGVDRFYLTNTHRHPPGFQQTLETYLQRSGAQVLYYGPGGFHVALDDLVFPNGINVSHDGRQLYVATVTPRSVRVYDRDPQTEKLSLQTEIPVGSGADNIEVDADGALWVGAHPQLLRVAAHAKNPAELSPSQVLRVSPDGKVDEIYLNDGSQISGSSVAAARGNRLLIGQIFGNGFLDCVMADRG